MLLRVEGHGKDILLDEGIGDVPRPYLQSIRLMRLIFHGDLMCCILAANVTH
jgi:hypothetical protein